MYSDLNFYFVAAISYLIGSIPFAIVVGHWGGIGDIRKLGSGNPGATNMARQGGKKLGAITLVCDILKGIIAVIIGWQLALPLVAALFVVLGHCFSIFLKLRGGKGVATTLGALYALNIYAGLIFTIIWLAMYWRYKISSLSALTTIWLTAIISLFIWPGNLPWLIIFFATLITARHHSNIKKLLAGTEN